MRLRSLVFPIIVLAQAASGADWVSGQAARGVFGQPSFSHSGGPLQPVSLSLSGGRLHVASNDGRVLSFLLQPVLQGKTNGNCLVCSLSPVSTTSQAVPASSARYASFGKSVAIADVERQRILYWRDGSQPGAAKGADVVLNVSAVALTLDAEHMYAADAATRRVLVWRRSTLSPAMQPDAILGSSEPSGAASVGMPVALASDGINLYVADADNRRVLVFSPADPVIARGEIVSAASQTPLPFAPGSLIAIRGNGLTDEAAAAIDDGETAAPTTLAGVELTVDGRPIPLLAVSPSEIRAQVPYDIDYSSSVSVALRWTDGVRSGRTSSPVAMPVRDVAPAIFAFPGTPEPRAAILLHRPESSPVTGEDPAFQDDVIVVLASGLGAVSAPDGNLPAAGKPFEGPASDVRAKVSALLDGEPAEVLSATLPSGSTGIYEVRLIVRRNRPAPSRVTLALRESETLSNTVTFPWVDHPRDK